MDQKFMVIEKKEDEKDTQKSDEKEGDDKSAEDGQIKGEFQFSIDEDDDDLSDEAKDDKQK